MRVIDFIVPLMRSAFIIIALTLVYIYLLTILFEYCINKASNSLLSLAGVLLFLVISFGYAAFLFKSVKKQPK